MQREFQPIEPAAERQGVFVISDSVVGEFHGGHSVSS